MIASVLLLMLGGCLPGLDAVSLAATAPPPEQSTEVVVDIDLSHVLLGWFVVFVHILHLWVRDPFDGSAVEMVSWALVMGFVGLVFHSVFVKDGDFPVIWAFQVVGWIAVAIFLTMARIFSIGVTIGLTLFCYHSGIPECALHTLLA